MTPRDPQPPAGPEPRAAFNPDDVAAALGISPGLLRALIRLASQPGTARESAARRSPTRTGARTTSGPGERKECR